MFNHSIKNLSVLVAVFVSLFYLSCSKQKYVIDYNQAIHLDAENLAEFGMKSSYDDLFPKLKLYVDSILPVTEIINNDNGLYLIKFNNKEYRILDSVDANNEKCWETAACVFFEIVNSQLKNTNTAFYALGGGNDLFGIFLTPKQADNSHFALKNKSDWPYIPRMDDPFLGMFH